MAWETLTAGIPIFVMIRLCVALLPSEIFPKFMLLELTVRVILLVFFSVLARPPQPERVKIARMDARAARDIDEL
ncbi:MAG: hypothetical protein AUH88_06740 [Acidobacteria bacterium 13_1_40CM_4_61_5]|nr:MAG: hypothetical protein AUH88_06740 [Acidobacteria bacterium 13_1_40CM_4_61_5]